ncbi:Acylamidase [Oceanibacterium hippocampi]|uniref:Acylamidase n=1 Tax=Oceanibacterium hippocampi TaxID=745714 RepID=A0A1Y5RK93_9PROT|nr:amidase family protein [Oceanibacterium hippocampi]SLN18344.1 Acylamidase [Oceanibacterium hippocampi]
MKWTAREAVARLGRGEVSPLELIDVAERRIAETDAALNALPTRCFDRARDKAKALMKTPPSERPPGFLHGLPVAIKDLNPVAGVRMTMGSPIYADLVPERSDILVEQLEANGAVVVAKSNTPEFGAGAQTFNEVFGTTTNPWNTALTPGGSSGGAASALAAGQVWLASGSDMGGSLRIPASFTGTVGLRPSPGRVASGPTPFCFGTLAVDGPMARNVGDVALMFDAMVGWHPEDPISLPAPERPFIEAVERPVAPRRVAYSPDLGISPIDPEVAEICAAAARRFAGLGIAVEEAGPDLSNVVECFDILRAVSFAASKGPLLAEHRDKMKPEVIWNIEAGLALGAADIGRAEALRGAIYARTAAFFRDYDLLLCPTVATPPFDHRIRYLDEIEGHRFDNYAGWLIMTFALTVTACPCISVPCGMTRDGRPVGLQILAPLRGEAALLSAAALFEAECGLADALPIDPRAGTP